MERKIHHGKNIARFRQMLGIKQEALASLLHNDWTQVNISRLEAKENIEEALLAQVAEALKIPVEAIRNFDEEAAIVNIQNNYEGANQGSGNIGANFTVATMNTDCTFNPLEKYIEAVEKIEKLYGELLRAKEEQVKLLERLTKN